MEQLDVLSKKGTTATVELSRMSDGNFWTVESIVFRFHSHFNRMMFREKSSIHTVLHQSLVAAILPYLPERPDAGLLSANGFHVNVNGTLIKGLRVITHPGSNGRDLLSLHLVDISGSPFNIAKPAYRGSDDAQEQCADLAAKTMVDLVKPCIELFEHILANGLSSEAAELIQPRLKTMKVAGERLSQYAEDLTDVLCMPRAKPDLAFAIEGRRPSPEGHEASNVLFGHQQAIELKGHLREEQAV